METNYAEKPYNERLQGGLEFQDFLAKALLPHGILIQPYSSLKYQLEQGESVGGIEIKYDRQFRETGNLAIETAEKSYASQVDFKPSGICRGDNSWLLVIGDYKRVYIFTMKMLRIIHAMKKRNGNPYREVEIATARMFLLPLVDAERYAAKRIDF